MHSVSIFSGGGALSGCRALAITLVVLLPSIAQAGRVGSIAISVDDRDWLSGSTYDNGSTPPLDVWRCLATNKLQPVEGVTISPEPSDPLRSTLRGKISLDVQYGGKATVEELRLVREDVTAGWTVDADDVERMGKDIGLADEPGSLAEPVPIAAVAGHAADETNQAFPWLWAAGVATVLAAVLFWVVMSGRAKAGRAKLP